MDEWIDGPWRSSALGVVRVESRGLVEPQLLDREPDSGSVIAVVVVDTILK